MLGIFEIIGVVCAGLFSGAAVYINAVEHPVRLQAATVAGLEQWRRSYPRAAVMQAGLAGLGMFAALGAGLSGGGTAWFAVGALLAAIIAFTLLAIVPTNRQLQSAALAAESAPAAMLLRRWGRLHAVRSVLGSAAFLISVLAVKSTA